MKIGIDARLIRETGVGRYIRNLLSNLAVIDERNRYIVYLRTRDYSSFSLPNRRWEKRHADVSWHSAIEQCRMPWYYLKDRLDIVHTPYFNAPIFYPGKYIVTVHDLTILHFATGKATTLPLMFYKLRRLGYLVAITVGLRRAAHILVPSRPTKQEIVDHLGISPEKITVTHEGVDTSMSNVKCQIPNKDRLIEEPYFLYVGNAYPHKNLEMLIEAFRKLISQGLALPRKARPYKTKDVRLVLVGKEDYFYQRLKTFVADSSLSDRVIFFGQATDQELANLYYHALALVFPSLMEGFGLPGLEAMAAGTPVVCSDIPVFREVYGNACLMFHPKDPSDIALKLREIHEDRNLRTMLVGKGKNQVARYSWRQMAKGTLAVYQNA